MRLSKEAISLIEDTVSQAAREMERLKTGRVTARETLRQMQEAVQLTRITLNSQRSVPVKANNLYTQARNERDILVEQSQQIDSLRPEQLDRFIEDMRKVLKKAEDATRLASQAGS